MILYVPERIYAEVKDNPTFIDIANRMEEVYSQRSSFEYAVSFNWVNNGDLKVLSAELDEFMKTVFKDKPNLLEEYLINNGRYTKQEMLVKYHTGDKEIYDYENQFFLLSNILNKSYEDETYKDYMQPYVDLFESTTYEEKEEKNLSQYIYLKYMDAKLYTMAAKINFLDPKWDKTFAEEAIALMNELNVYDDTDIFENSFLESYTNAVSNLMNRNPDLTTQEILTLLSRVQDLVNADTFQYYDCSYSVLDFMDKVNMLYLVSGNYVAVHHMTSTICNYISNSLKDLDRTLRGLAYYDKANHVMYAIYIRKYLKLTETCKFLNNIKINYLTDRDREFILSDRIGGEVATNPFNAVVESRGVLDVDKFFENNGYIEEMDKLIVEDETNV